MIHRCSHRVRSYEIDGYGHVNNAVYLNYLEYARGEYLKDIGFDYPGCLKAGFGLWIARIEIDFKSPALLHDQLIIETSPAERKMAYGILEQRILKGENLCACARVKWAFVEIANSRPRPIPIEFDVPGLNPGKA
jgi:acyl-CoA thioester hydrolase